MGFNYGMRGKSTQQQAIVRRRENTERILKEETEKRKKDEASDFREYSFNFEGVKNNLTKEKYEYLVEEIKIYKDTIIKQLLIEEKSGKGFVCTPLAISESEGLNFIELLSKEICFTRQGNVIKVYRR